MTKITSQSKLINLVGNTKVGSDVSIKIWRENKIKTIIATIKKPNTKTQKQTKKRKASNQSTLDKKMSIRIIGTENNNGVKITEILNQSPLKNSQVRVGDIIQSINFNSVFTVKIYKQIIEKLTNKKQLILTIRREEGRGSYQIFRMVVYV